MTLGRTCLRPAPPGGMLPMLLSLQPQLEAASAGAVMSCAAQAFLLGQPAALLKTRSCQWSGVPTCSSPFSPSTFWMLLSVPAWLPGGSTSRAFLSYSHLRAGCVT